MGAWSSLPAGLSSNGCSVALIRVANSVRLSWTDDALLPTAGESVDRSRPPHSNLDSVHQGDSPTSSRVAGYHAKHLVGSRAAYQASASKAAHTRACSNRSTTAGPLLGARPPNSIHPLTTSLFAFRARVVLLPRAAEP